jgi:hypothetical protein
VTDPIPAVSPATVASEIADNGNSHRTMLLIAFIVAGAALLWFMNKADKAEKENTNGNV